MLGYLAPFTLPSPCGSLPGLGEILLCCQLARGQGEQISLRKDSSQGAHN